MPIQKKMYKLRHRKDKPNVMFDSKWSGYILKANKDNKLFAKF